MRRQNWGKGWVQRALYRSPIHYDLNFFFLSPLHLNLKLKNLNHCMHGHLLVVSFTHGTLSRYRNLATCIHWVMFPKIFDGFRFKNFDDCRLGGGSLGECAGWFSFHNCNSKGSLHQQHISSTIVTHYVPPELGSITSDHAVQHSLQN